MPTIFLLLRIFTGLLVGTALAIVVLIMLFHTVVNFAKEGVGVLGYVVALFTSGFTKGTPPEDPQGWLASLPQIGLAVLFISMIVSLFYPGTKVLLHVVAGMGAVAVIWYARMLFTGPEMEVLCLPFFPIWFVYYAMCIWGRLEGR